MTETVFMTDADFEQYRRLIYRESGINFTGTNRPILESKLRERLRGRGLPGVGAYYDVITRDKEEMRSFLDAVTTNLTRFFRNQAHFEALEKFVAPEIIRARRLSGMRSASGPPVIKIWSAGCSTGEEPYSIAMLLAETLPPLWTYEITASDLSLKSLMAGQEGFYADSRLSGVPDDYLRKYFDRVEGGCRVKSEIRRRIRFDYHNLRHDSGLRNLDVVFCRNVLIYFDEAAQAQTIARFWEAMAPLSYLFIGHSESLFGMKTGFEFVKTQWATLYRKAER
jgi:chemotaxis protein methyltransferase CheR